MPVPANAHLPMAHSAFCANRDSTAMSPGTLMLADMRAGAAGQSGFGETPMGFATLAHRAIPTGCSVGDYLGAELFCGLFPTTDATHCTHGRSNPTMRAVRLHVV